MTILESVFASAGTDVILHTLEISSDAYPEPIFLVRDYADHNVTLEDGRQVTMRASGFDIALPKRDASGGQSLTFALDGVRGEATNRLREAVAVGQEVRLIYRCYLLSDLSAPAEQPLNFIVRDFKAQSDVVQITAGLFDLIDMRWPRDVYNTVITPGIKYMQ